MNSKRLFRFMIALLTVLSLCVGLLPGQTLAAASGRRTLCAPAAAERGVGDAAPYVGDDAPAALPAPGDQVTMNGDGSASNPYQITTYAQLKEFRDLVNGGQTGICGKLMNDITADDDTWTPIGAHFGCMYNGTFDGNGKIIRDLSNAGLSSDVENVGLFGIVYSGTVKDLTLVDVCFHGRDNIGSVAADNDGTIEFCNSSGTVTGSSDVATVGGITAKSSYIVSSCCSTCTVAGDIYVGGIVGFSTGGSIENCCNAGAVSGRIFIGGICGHGFANTKGCFNTGTVSGRMRIGGIIGENYALPGLYYGVVENCCNTGAVMCAEQEAGGIAGSNGGTVQNCCNLGTVSAEFHAGGVLGAVSVLEDGSAGALINCFNTGAVTAEANTGGGIVAKNSDLSFEHDTIVSGVVDNCYWLSGTAKFDYGNAMELTADEFRQQWHFPGWDFSNTWFMGSDTPLLSAFTHVISNQDHWNQLAADLESGKDTRCQLWLQTADLSVTTMAGSDGKPFRGVYDGGGHTLTFKKDNAPERCAPFVGIRDAVIQDLHIAGAINTTHKYAAGIAAIVRGNCLIRDCRSSVTIYSSIDSSNHDGTHGGFIAVCMDNSGTQFEGCVFDGACKGTPTTLSAAYVGFSRNCTVSFRDCVMNASAFTWTNSRNFIRNGENTALTLDNCYHLGQVADHAEQGKKGWIVKAGENARIDFGQPEGELYTVSRIKPYPAGLEYNGVFYAGQNDQIKLNLNWTGSGEMPPYTEFLADAGTLTNQNGSYTLTMPGQNVTIYAHTHVWGAPTYEWSEDDGKVTAAAVCGADASHILTETVKTNFVLTQPSTFEDEGAGYYEAVFENPIFQKQIKEAVVPPVECAGGDDCPSKNFTDMPSIKSTMHIPIDWAVVNKITTGTSPTTFGTKNSCTRAQFVTFLWRTRGQPEPTSTENPFTDVKESGFYYKAMLWAVEEGITAGTSPTTFGPNKPCTRAQVVTFLWRMEGSQEPASTENPFTDVKESGFYYKAMLWAVGKGITTGTSPTTFGPGSDCTRAQCVTFLYREFAT